MPDDTVVEYLRTLGTNPRAQALACKEILAESKPIAQKAQWAYEHYRSRAGSKRSNPHSRRSFADRYLSAWGEAILNMANTCRSCRIELPEAPNGVLFIGWHFPEYPELIPYAVQTNTMVLLASREWWMRDLEKAGCAYYFREAAVSSLLLQAFRRRRPIFAMLDYYYENTRYVVTKFLSYYVRVPVGVLELARIFKYQIALISIRRHSIQIVHTLEGKNDVSENAKSLMREIEVEILRKPERWLQWPSVNHHWLDVQYDT